jgi:hypothetical protein
MIQLLEVNSYLVNPILDNIRSERGLTDFRVVLSVAEDIDEIN